MPIGCTYSTSLVISSCDHERFLGEGRQETVKPAFLCRHCKSHLCTRLIRFLFLITMQTYTLIYSLCLFQVWSMLSCLSQSRGPDKCISALATVCSWVWHVFCNFCCFLIALGGLLLSQLGIMTKRTMVSLCSVCDCACTASSISDSFSCEHFECLSMLLCSMAFVTTTVNSHLVVIRPVVL